MRPEEDLLKKSKTRLREEQILKAEALRRDGMTYEYIADDMMLPVSTIKRWVSCIKPKMMPDGSNPLHLPKRSAAWGGSPTPNPSPKERGFEDLNTDYCVRV
ncbi:MAG: hypothetical protein M0D57_13810 [Sphingobacteriales bacterium JAD_PAG50586_3]|nr:MAG: hypothetical protein M0D57_13810 [Sphingobacteriales bacterium JAD_PAG50586_3]